MTNRPGTSRANAGTVMSVFNFATLAVIVGVGWIILHVVQRRRAGSSLIDLSFAKNATQIGILLLVIAAIGAWSAMQMDTSVATDVGRINNIGLMASQQNKLILFGFLGLIGALLLIFAKRR